MYNSSQSRRNLSGLISRNRYITNLHRSSNINRNVDNSLIVTSATTLLQELWQEEAEVMAAAEEVILDAAEEAEEEATIILLPIPHPSEDFVLHLVKTYSIMDTK